MPELPEVETIARTLQLRLPGLTIAESRIMLSKVIHAPTDGDDFIDLIKGKQIMRICRRGKYLLVYLSEGYCLMFHFRMTGNLTYCQADQPFAKHTHLIMYLDNGCQLRYADTRQFGGVWLLTLKDLEQTPGYRELGPEPFDPSFTAKQLRELLNHKHRRIKTLLLDQTIVAGLGNIYADEALHRAGINPETTASALNRQAVSRLHKSIRAVLREGIDNRGASIRDYIDGEGQSGNYQNLLRVYGKEGRPCTKCGAYIIRKKISGRSSFFCPACQQDTTAELDK